MGEDFQAMKLASLEITGRGHVEMPFSQAAIVLVALLFFGPF